MSEDDQSEEIISILKNALADTSRNIMRATAGLQKAEATNTTSFSNVDINEAGASSHALSDILTSTYNRI